MDYCVGCGWPLMRNTERKSDWQREIDTYNENKAKQRKSPTRL